LNRTIVKISILTLSIIIIIFCCSPVLANESPVINYAVTEIFVEDRDSEVVWIDYEKAVLDSIDWGIFGSGDSTMYDRAVKEVIDALINSRQIWFRVRVVGEGSERPQIYIHYSEALKNGVTLKNIVTYYRLNLNEMPDYSKYIIDNEPDYSRLLLLNDNGAPVKIKAVEPGWLGELIVVWDEVLNLLVVDIVLDEDGLADLDGTPVLTDVSKVLVKGEEAIEDSNQVGRWRILFKAAETEHFWDAQEDLTVDFKDIVIVVNTKTYRWDTP